MTRLRNTLFMTTLALAAPFASAASFTEGTFEGMPDVLMLNNISAMVLARAPDTVLYTAAKAYMREDLAFWSQKSNWENSAISLKDHSAFVTLKPLLLAKPVESNADTPNWAQCFNAFEDRPNEVKDAPQARTSFGRRPQVMTPSCGKGPAGEAKLNVSIDHAISMVRAVQADVKKATQFGVSVLFHYRPGRDTALLNGTLNANAWGSAKDAVKVSDLDQVSDPVSPVISHTPQKTGAGIAVRLGWGTMDTMLPNGQLNYCLGQTYDAYGAADVSLIAKGDPSELCVDFKGFKGVTIPTHMMLRDVSQFKEGDDLRLVIVFSVDSMGAVGQNPVGTVSSIVNATPAYAQIVDLRTRRAIGNRISFATPKTFATLRTSSCMRNMHANNMAEASLAGCIDEGLRAAGEAPGANIANLKEFEANYINTMWGTK